MCILLKVIVEETSRTEGSRPWPEGVTFYALFERSSGRVYFSSIWRICFTLFQVSTLDEWSKVVKVVWDYSPVEK